MTKDLKDKAVDIKGKKYVLVSDRILYFNENYEKGSIQTELVSEPGDTRVLIKARVCPNAVEQPTRFFTGYSQATWGDSYINKAAALENAETSAVGRALAMMGIGVIDSVASVDELHKAGAVSTVNTATPAVDPLAKVRLPDEMAPVASPAPAGIEEQLGKDIDESLKATNWCNVHDVEMKRRDIPGGDGFYFDHRKKEGETWFRCNGRDGWVAQKARV